MWIVINYLEDEGHQLEYDEAGREAQAEAGKQVKKTYDKKN